MVEVVALLVSLYMITSRVKSNNCSKNGNVNKKTILLHLINVGILTIGCFVFFFQFVYISAPNRTCMDYVNFLKEMAIKDMINEVLIATTQIITFSICYMYAMSAKKLHQVATRKESSMDESIKQ